MNECFKVCHEVADDDKELWIGCDACSNWYHYPCINLPGIPDAKHGFHLIVRVMCNTFTISYYCLIMK